MNAWGKAAEDPRAQGLAEEVRQVGRGTEASECQPVAQAGMKPTSPDSHPKGPNHRNPWEHVKSRERELEGIHCRSG